MDKTRNVIGWFVQLLCWVLLLASVFVLLTAVLIPRFTNATPYTIATGSMQPVYPPGTLVVVRSTPAEDLKTGDVITYQLKSGEPTVVTHRIVGMGTSVKDETLFQTKGDANGAVDPGLVRPVQVRGAVWYHVPYAGFISDLVSTAHRSMLNYALIGALAIYALWQFWGAYRERRQGNNEKAGDEDDSAAGGKISLATSGAIASFVGVLVAALLLPTGAYWNAAQPTIGTPVTSGQGFSCRVFNENNNSDIGGATCEVSLASCPQINGNAADVYLNVQGAGVNGNAANRVIEIRTTLRGMGCNPPGLNWTTAPNEGIAAGPLFTVSSPCAELPVLTARIAYVNRGTNVLLGRLYYNRTAQTVSCS